MGLDVSHDCFSGPYSAFNRWRVVVAEAAGIPLHLMEGFLETEGAFSYRWRQLDEELRYGLPLRWDVLKPDPVHALLNHSDCDGHLTPGQARRIADRLETLLPSIRERAPEFKGVRGVGLDAVTEQFIAGCRAAYAAKERVEFF